MTEKVLKTITDLLDNEKKIVIVGHKNPDGDAIGSCLGLYFFLKNRGHETTVVMPNDFPDFLKWLPGCDQILQFERQTQATTEVISSAEIIFTLDFNALNRTGDLGAVLEKLSTPFVLIDHHQQPDDYAIACYSDVSMSSTSEMVYHLIEALNGQNEVSKEIATNLYMGIMTDTGSFRFPSTSATTHRVIAHLIDCGANGSEIHQNIYDSNSADRMKLLGVALENMVIIQDLRTAYITLSQEELDACNFKKGDTEGFVNYPLAVEGVIFSIIFIENKQEGIIKISLRSKGNFNVNEFARNHFNGGGHVNASGGRSSLSLSDTVKEFISILPPYKNALNHDS
jgi:bifunctional oligoribonuclease and PAP phosphatase NrnA